MTRTAAGAVAPYPLDHALPELASRAQVGAALTEGVIVKDATDRTIWFNAAACRLLARTPDEMLGATTNRERWSICGRDGRRLPDARWPFEVARTSGRPVEGVLARGTDGHGRPVWLELSAVPTTRSGEPATIVVFRDVTEAMDYRLQLEATIGEVNRTLVQERLPAGDRMQFAGRIRSFGGPSFISGDFYGVHEVGGSTYAFYIGDVCGHGVTSAGISSLARHTMRSAALLHRDPAAVLGHLHEVLDAENHRTYVTAVFGFVERVDDVATVRFAIGGHPRPVLVTDRGVSEHGRTGQVVGMVDNTSRPVTTIRLRPGERMVLFTDGLVRTRWGECSAVPLLDGLRAGRPVEETIDEVLELRRRKIDDEQHDDIATLVIGL